MQDSLQTLQKLVEKETAQGHSWDIVVPLLVLRELIQVNSRLEALSKVLANGGSNTSDADSDTRSEHRDGGLRTPSQAVPASQGGRGKRQASSK